MSGDLRTRSTTPRSRHRGQTAEDGSHQRTPWLRNQSAANQPPGEPGSSTRRGGRVVRVTARPPRRSEGQLGEVDADAVAAECVHWAGVVDGGVVELVEGCGVVLVVAAHGVLRVLVWL